MNRVSNRPFSLQVVSQAEGSACCMDGSGRGTAMICLPVVHFNDGRIDGRLVGRLNAASATTTFHALPRKTSEVGLSLILPLPPSLCKQGLRQRGGVHSTLNWQPFLWCSSGSQSGDLGRPFSRSFVTFNFKGEGERESDG